MEKSDHLDPAVPGWVSLLSAPPYTPAGVASRPLLQAPGIRVVWMGLDANQELTEHTTPKRALVQMIEGTCDFQLGNEWQRLSSGDLIHMTPGLLHAVRAITRTAFLLFLIPDGTPGSAQQPPSTALRLSLTTADDSLQSQSG